jgi:hypothetical protein
VIRAREILSGDRLGSTVFSGPIYLFGLLVTSVAWIGNEVWVRDHMGGGWTFQPDAPVRCLQRWNGEAPA